MLNRKVGLAGLGLAALLLACCVSKAPAEEAQSAGEKQVQAQDPQQAAIEKKLKEILKRQEEILTTQKTILQKFDAVMEELRILKVRVSLHSN